jgi:hypothetical protein
MMVLITAGLEPDTATVSRLVEIIQAVPSDHRDDVLDGIVATYRAELQATAPKVRTVKARRLAERLRNAIRRRVREAEGVVLVEPDRDEGGRR